MKHKKRRYEEFMIENRDSISYFLKQEYKKLYDIVKNGNNLNDVSVFLWIIIGLCGAFNIVKINWATIVVTVLLVILCLYYVFFASDRVTHSISQLVFRTYLCRIIINEYLNRKKEEEIESLMKNIASDFSKWIGKDIDSNIVEDMKQIVPENIKYEYEKELHKIKSFYSHCSEKILVEVWNGTIEYK